MKIITTVNKRRVTASSRDELISKIRGRNLSICFGSLGDGLYNYKGRDLKSITVYNLEKHNAKKTQKSSFSKTNTYQTEKGAVRKTKVVAPTVWIAYVYEFPVELIKCSKIKLKQHKRHFSM